MLIGVLCAVAGTFGVASFYLNYTSQNRARELDTSARALRQHMEGDMLHDALRGEVYAALVLAADPKSPRRDTLQSEVKHDAAEFRAQLAANLKLDLKPARLSGFEALRTPIDEYCSLCEELVELAFTDAAAARARLPQLEESFQKLEELQDKVSEALLADDTEAREATRTAGVLFLRVLVVTFTVAGGIYAFLIYKLEWVTRCLQSVLKELDRATKGTLSRANLLADMSGTLANGSSQQAESLQTSSSSLTQMAAMTKRSAEHARSAKELANRTRLSADSSISDMRAMQQAMDGIHESSVQIAKITQAIDEIAFQTNILALNAAVEAARAGEAGLGA